MQDDFKRPRRPLSGLARIKSLSEPPEQPIDLPKPQETPLNNTPAPRPVVARRRPGILHKIFRKPRNRQEWFVLIMALILIIGGTGGAVYAMTRKKPIPPPPVVKKEEPKPVPPPPKPTTESSRLTGVQVAPELNKRPVTGIMIENSPDARPQSGLKDAGIVFEAVAEGGITRFLALYQEAQPDYIGPVRSARPYYLDWVAPFDAGLAHVGGSPDALVEIRRDGIKDLDQFDNPGSFTRIASRYAPHNVYTSMAQMDALNQKRGYTESKFTSFERKAESPSPQPIAKSIDLVLSGFLYNVHYEYDAPTNSYKRNEGGRPHTDERSGAHLAPKVVIALVMPKGIASDGLHSEYATIGNGKMYVFQDGIMIEGTWHKTTRKNQFVFTDSSGAIIKLNPGQTWITMVNSTSAVSAK